MRISIYNKRIIYICIFLLVLLSCTSQRKEVNKMPKPTAIDLLLISRYDSIYTYPVKMKDEFKKAQKGLTDSTEFYKLDLFVGLCFYLQ